jgi:hypothetical protein
MNQPRLRSFGLRALLLTLMPLLSACGGVPFRMQAPEAFKRFEETDDFRYITADGVRLRGRLLKNEPIADLAFWREALRGHLEKRGYVFQSEDCFRTAAGLDGCTLDFVLPHGAEDWVHSETLFVRGEDLMLVEVAGPFALYTPHKASLQAALRTFEPGR